MEMRVYVSGGPNRSRNWGTSGSKAEVMDIMKSINPSITFVRSGTSDYIVIPDDETEPSDTALKTQGKVMKLSKFVSMLKRGAGSAASSISRPSRSTTRKNANEKKSSTRRAPSKTSASTCKKLIRARLYGKKWGRGGHSTAEMQKILTNRAQEAQVPFHIVSSGPVDYLIIPKLGSPYPMISDETTEVLSLRQLTTLLDDCKIQLQT